MLHANPQSIHLKLSLPPIITHISQLIHDHGGRAYLVGGVVRDAVIDEYLGLTFEQKDYDIEVFGMTFDEVLALLEEDLNIPVSMEGKQFRVVKVHYQSGEEPIDVAIAREEISTGKGHKDFQIQENPDLSLSEAAKRRDLTINALYYDPLEQTVYDSFGGIQDIKQQRIDIINPRTFVEDPLRVLRVMQLASRFGFTIEKQVVEAAKEIVQAGMMQTLSLDRVREEFMKLGYLSKQPSTGLQFLKDIGALSQYSATLTALGSIKQTPDWHPEGSVWVHTLQTVNAGVDIAERERLSPYEKAVLLFACLCHDLGKKESTWFDEEKQVYHAYGHSESGVEPTIEFLQNINAPSFITSSVPVLVKQHMRFLYLYQNYQQGHDQTKAFRRLQKQLNRHDVAMELLVWLMEADMRGRNPAGLAEPLSYDETKRLYEVADWVSAMQQRIAETGKPGEDLVSGETILSAIGEKPGPWVGALKELVQDFVHDAKVKEAIARPYLFDEEGKVQPELIKQMYELVESEGVEWEEVKKDEGVRDEVIEKVLKSETLNSKY